jgi:hypothetical protein
MLVWPFSYAWIPLGERSPAWVFILVPLAEVAAIALGVVAVWRGLQARRREGDSPAARWAVALGAVTLALVIGGNVLGVIFLT